MKRFHVQVAVANLAARVEFYSKLFGQAPSKTRPDYAKWMLDDPRVNFAISARGHDPRRGSGIRCRHGQPSRGMLHSGGIIRARQRVGQECPAAFATLDSGENI